MKVNKSGYEETNQGKLVHRENYKKAYGQIKRGWVVHHVDENKLNNEISNLVALPERLHNLLHAFQKKHGRWLNREEIEAFLKGRAPKKFRLQEKKSPRMEG